MQTRKQTGKGRERGKKKKKNKQKKNENTYLLLSDFRGNARGYTEVNDSIVSSSKAITSCLNASLYSRQAGRQAPTHPGACNSVQAPPSVSNLREGGEKKEANNHIAYIFSSRHIGKEWMSAWRISAPLTISS